MIATLTSCWLGFLIGLRHALEPDHLAAVSTLIVEQPRIRRAAFLGTCWGLGHSLSLLAVGGGLLAWRLRLPEVWVDRFELAVAVLLIGLGVRSILWSLRAGRDGGSAPHSHGGILHAHAGVSDHFHISSLTVARRPFLVGIAHGLAGTGAITALAMASMPGTISAIAYLALFGLGALAGMSLLTGLAGVAMLQLAYSPRARSVLAGGVGVFSVLLGVFWGGPILFRLLPQ